MINLIKLILYLLLKIWVEQIEKTLNFEIVQVWCTFIIMVLSIWREFSSILLKNTKIDQHQHKDAQAVSNLLHRRNN
jgi:hypothetical protein